MAEFRQLVWCCRVRDMATLDTNGLGWYFRRCSIFCRAEIPPLKQMDDTYRGGFSATVASCVRLKIHTLIATSVQNADAHNSGQQRNAM